MKAERQCIICNYDKIFRALFLAVLLIGVLVRLYMCFFQFTVCDDLGTAVSILYGESGQKWSLQNCINGFNSFWNFGWTYAPLQGILISLILSPSYSYRAIIILGRFPSFLCGCFALFGLWRLLIGLFEQEQQHIRAKICVLTGVILLSLSYENIIYSAQMEPYAVGVLGSIVFLWLLKWNRKHFNMAISTIIVVLFCSAQYQLFIFAFVFYIIRMLCSIRDHKELAKIFLSAISAAFLTVPVWSFVLMGGMKNRGINWNRGINGEYLFSPDDLKGYEFIKYTISFVINNLKQCFQYLLLPCKMETLASIAAVMLLAIAIVGLVKMHSKDNRVWRDIAWYIDFILLIHFALVFLGKLSLSPSRHSLVLTPLFLVCISFGLHTLMDVFQRKIFFYMLCGMNVLIVIFFFAELPEQVKQRTNRVSEGYLLSLFDEYDFDCIVTYGYSMDIYAMKQDKYATEIDQWLYNGIVYPYDFNFGTIKEGANVLFFSNLQELDEVNLDMSLEYVSHVIQQKTGETIQIQAEKEYEHINYWGGATQEYCGSKFFSDCYGEYVYIFRVMGQSE